MSSFWSGLIGGFSALFSVLFFLFLGLRYRMHLIKEQEDAEKRHRQKLREIEENFYKSLGSKE